VEFDRPVRVRLVNECELVHAGLTQMLAEHADRVTVLPQGAGRDEIADVALVDPFTRRSDDDASVPTTVTRPPGTARVAVFTWECRDGFVERAMLGGADGYLAKELPALELVAAIEKVQAGERIVALDLRRRTEPQASPVIGSSYDGRLPLPVGRGCGCGAGRAALAGSCWARTVAPPGRSAERAVTARIRNDDRLRQDRRRACRGGPSPERARAPRCVPVSRSGMDGGRNTDAISAI